MTISNAPDLPYCSPWGLAESVLTVQSEPMGDTGQSQYEGAALRAVRPYLIVGDAAAAIDFYINVFGASELERHRTPAGGVGHAKVQIGETIVELGEHPSASSRVDEPLPRVGLRLYVGDVDETYQRAVTGGAAGDAPSERLPGSRSATIYDPFGLTWWLVEKTAGR